MHDYFFIKRINLLELLAIVVIFIVLAAVLIPVVGNIIVNANNQVDIAHARLLLVSTTIAIGMDGLGNGVYTANADGSSPFPYHDLLGSNWPVSHVGLDYLIVDVDFSRNSADAIQIIRIVDDVVQVYRTDKGIFE